MNRVSPPYWTPDQLRAAQRRAIAIFREQRISEPLEAYLEAYEGSLDAVENLLEMTTDLSTLRDQAAEVASDPAMVQVARYLASPPISEADLKVLAGEEEDASLSRSSLQRQRSVADRVVTTILDGLDRRRFPWVGEDRLPTAAEKQAAAIATASLIASRRVMTQRANEAKKEQEQAVSDRLLREGFTQVRQRSVATTDDAPTRGEFCGESMFDGRKADIVVRLWDGRVMPIECKVTNSYTNSIKRLNNDAAVKAGIWLKEFGTANVVPVAVLAGVFKLINLQQAQERGLVLFWAHSLDDMMAFIERTRQA